MMALAGCETTKHAEVILNRPGFELTARSWTALIPPIRRRLSADTPSG